jgi:hypothetical protein
MDYVFDIEFYKNFFCVNFMSFPDGGERITFEISQRKDQRYELIEFLKQKGLRLIGYNNVGYDYPVLHMLIESPEISLMVWWKKVQRDIFNERKGIVWESQRHVFQIDLFKINHYDNKARSTSLKWLEFTKRWHKVQDLPIDPQKSVTEAQMRELIQYCWNDVEFTFDLALDCWGAVEFRENMSEVLGRNVMDYSDVKIGEYLNQKKYEELTGKTWKDFKDGRTYRQKFAMADIIPDSIKFETPLMQKFLEDLREVTFVDGDKKFRYDIIFANGGGFLYVEEGGLTTKSGLNDTERIKAEHEKGNSILTFAKGGLHTIELPRVVERKEGWRLMEKDVGSMYPRSIVVDGIYPEHLGAEWNESINRAYHYRLDVLKPKLKELEYKSDEWNKVNDEQAVYKLAMNGGGFGKLGSAYSWQFDPLAKYRVTMGCELKLLMLIEQFLINGIEVVSVNTDGVVVHYPEEMQEVVDRIHKEWEAATDFLLEDTYYNKIVFSSVNDYIAVIVDEKTDEVKKVKYKGDFEIDKEPHKNNSQRIVAIALSEYFTKGVPLKECVGVLGYTFDNDDKQEQVTIYDYCIGRKKTSSCDYWLVKSGKAHKLDDKVIRYYIANGSRHQLLKKYTKGKLEGRYTKINAGFDVRMFMTYFPPSGIPNRNDYDIDVNYYLNECRKIVDSIESGTRIYEGGRWVQGTLF